MTNEELVARIKAGETDLMSSLWEQVKLYAYKRANMFYYLHSDRCAEVGVELDDLEQEAYLAIHMAVEKFNADKGVKFLTYAEYRLKAGLYAAAKMKNGGDRYHEVKLDDITICEGNSDEAILLADTLSDPSATEALDDVVEQVHRQEYQAELKFALDNAFESLRGKQKDTATACLKNGLTQTEYARQTGVTLQATSASFNLALRKLRTHSSLAAYAALFKPCTKPRHAASEIIRRKPTMNTNTATINKYYATLSNTKMTAEDFWKLPKRTRDAIEETLLFYGECVVWYETDNVYGSTSNGFHIVQLGCNMGPMYAADFRNLGRMTREMLPEMWAHYLKNSVENGRAA